MIAHKKKATKILCFGDDRVIVGSAFVDIIDSGRDMEQRLEALARELKEGIRAARG